MSEFDPRRFIDIGKKIAEDVNYDSEARIRTAINRIYYGIMHFLRISYHIFLYSDEEIKKYHENVISRIKDIDLILGAYLDNIKRKRVKADYYLDTIVEENDLTYVLKFCERAYNRVNTLRDVS